MGKKKKGEGRGKRIGRGRSGEAEDGEEWERARRGEGMLMGKERCGQGGERRVDIYLSPKLDELCMNKSPVSSKRYQHIHNHIDSSPRNMEQLF